MSYSDNREKNFEYKLVRKSLAALDKRIEVPQSVRGAALRQLLEDVPVPSQSKADAHVPASLKPTWLRWQSGLSYAAVFALIVSLFYGLGFNQKGDIVSGQLQIAANTSEPATLPAAPFAAALQDEQASSVPETAPQAAPRTTAGAGATRAAANTRAGYAESAQAITAESAEESGVGGSGQAAVLLSQDGYTYSYRASDETDPDNAAALVTLEIVEEASGRAVTQMGIADLQTVEALFVQDGILMLAGTFENTVIARSYNIADIANPKELGFAAQPGRYLTARVYKDMLHILTLDEEPEAEKYDAEKLPGSLSDSVCIVGYLSDDGKQTAQKAFAGATADVKLYNLNAFIYYYSREENAEAAELHCAQIGLNGADIELVSAS